MSKVKAEKAKASHGGVREGSGRKQVYGEPCDVVLKLRVNDEQGEVIGAWCRKRSVSVTTLIREVALARVGYRGTVIGLDKLRGTATKEVSLEGASAMPVKFTAKQAAAVERFCAAKRVPVSSWLKEITLDHIGKGTLGVRGEVSTLERALG